MVSVTALTFVFLILLLQNSRYFITGDKEAGGVTSPMAGDKSLGDYASIAGDKRLGVPFPQCASWSGGSVGHVI